MQLTVVGVLVGLILGVTAAFGDFGDFCIVALFGAAGFIVAKVIQGDIDLGDVVDRTRQAANRPPAAR